jgi:putative SOS response-associated peptidase YedK
MCNLYRLDAPANQIAAHFGADPGSDPWAGGYVAPKRPGPVVVGNGQPGGARRLVPMLWGFPPPPQGRAPVTNVRNLASPFWIGTLRHADLRCLVPVTAFQEWSGDAGAKRQHWFGVPSRPIFAFAGIFRHTDDWPCFAFLTCEPNRLVGAVHPKAMPLILHSEDYDSWLSDDWNKASALVVPFPSQLMKAAESVESLAS